MSSLPVNGTEIWEAGCEMSRAKGELCIAGIGNDIERLRLADLAYDNALMAFAALTLSTYHAAAQRREQPVVSLGQGTSKVDIVPEDILGVGIDVHGNTIAVQTEREP